MNSQELKTILEKHQKWLQGIEGGERANLERAKLVRVNFEGANLERANLRGADLRGANLRGANLEGANLERANLEGANLEGVNLRGANLEGVNFRGANLRGANLRGADLSNTEGILGFYLGRHFGYAWRNHENQIIVKIGCQELEIGKMIKQSKELGIEFGYSKSQIGLYTDILKSIKKRGIE